MKTYMLVFITLTLLNSGCLRSVIQEETTTTTINWIDITFKNIATTTTTSSTSTETSTTTYTTTIKTYTTTSVTTTTTTTTTSTTTTAKKQYMPVRIQVKEEYQMCDRSTDCIIVGDCCGGVTYGFRYAINNDYLDNWVNFLKHWCDDKSHRTGCGWRGPDYTQAKCEDKKCVLTYGGIIYDGLQDENFTYSWDGILGRNKNDTNKT